MKYSLVVRNLLDCSWILYSRKSRRLVSRFSGCAPLFLSLAACANLFLAGCQSAGEPSPEITIEHEIAPQPPRTGPATVTLKLLDAGRSAIKGAQVSLEGNMSHAGMRPVFGEAIEIEPGLYQAPLEFTMGGDWVILVHITLPDGKKLQRQVEVKAVRSE